jgi:phosphopantetheinyl transferase (holo-ACP synthase)
VSEQRWTFGGVKVQVDERPQLVERMIAERIAEFRAAQPETGNRVTADRDTADRETSESVRVSHLCPRCGATDHGPLAVRAPYFASRSYSGNLTAAALTTTGPIGVDIESISRVRAAPVESVLLHSAERADLADSYGIALDDNRHTLDSTTDRQLRSTARDRRLTQLWTAKEAVLKLAGVGLDVDPCLLRLELRDEQLRLVEWPDSVDLDDSVVIRLFEVTDDILGAVATDPRGYALGKRGSA